MAVPADEYVGRLVAELILYRGRPSLRMASDVRHPDPNIAQDQPLIDRCTMADSLAVDVAPNRIRRRERLELIQDVFRTDISGVEYGINAGKIVGDRRLEVAVRI